MPIMDGLEATKRIRQREQELGLVRTPIVALSASLEPEERERGASAGMDDWYV
jgi:CheY-like chemotaxis protein